MTNTEKTLEVEQLHNETTPIQEDASETNIENFEVDAEAAEAEAIGQVLSLKDGVAFVSGLRNVKTGEMVSFINSNLYGMALNLETQQVGCIIFGDDTDVRQNDPVKALNLLVNTPVGEALLGRVVDSLGIYIDGKEELAEDTARKNIERKAPGVITRKSVSEPLLTGYKIVDALLPIGRGQRELIIGDRQTGKTTLAIDTILNQRYYNVDDIEIYCVYVAIGQKKSSVLNIQKLLEKNDAMFYTTIVAATAAQNASLQFIAPYTGCSIAEFFRDNGRHAANQNIDPFLFGFDLVPVKTSPSKFSRIFRKVAEVACIAILYYRSFFITEKSHYIIVRYLFPLSTVLWISLNHLGHASYFNGFTHAYVVMAFGVNLIVYDNLGSLISENTLASATPLLATATIHRLQKSKYAFVRYTGTQTFAGLFIGKGMMTVTGRTSLLLGAGSGITWLANQHLDRQAQNARAAADRDARATQANRDRDARTAQADADRHAQTNRMTYDTYVKAQQDIYKTQMDSYNKRGLFKGPIPQAPKIPSFEEYCGKK